MVIVFHNNVSSGLLLFLSGQSLSYVFNPLCTNVPESRPSPYYQCPQMCPNIVGCVWLAVTKKRLCFPDANQAMCFLCEQSFPLIPRMTILGRTDFIRIFHVHYQWQRTGFSQIVKKFFLALMWKKFADCKKIGETRVGGTVRQLRRKWRVFRILSLQKSWVIRTLKNILLARART